MRKVLNQLLAPCEPRVHSPSAGARALAPGAWLPLPTGSDGLFSRERSGGLLRAGGRCHWSPAARGAEECSIAAYISKTPMENQEWKKHSPRFRWASLPHHKQPRKCVMGTTRCLPGQSTFFQAKGLELRLFCFMPFLGVSCL